MRKRLLLVFVLLGQIAFGQTEKLIKILGTKCSLIPPSGFEPISNFSGFKNAKNGASIFVAEIPAPFQTFTVGFTHEALQLNGMTLIKKETINFRGTKALLLNVRQPFNGQIFLKHILMFGDTNETVIVNGIYPESSKEIGKKIKKSLLSTVYNNDQKDNPLEAATFVVDTKDTDFKLLRYIAGSLIYSIDDKFPTMKPTFIVGNSYGKIPLQDFKKFSEERLKKLPLGDDCIIKETNEITIDSLKGFEIIAESKNQEQKTEMAYQVTLFNNGEYVMMVGLSTEDFDKYLKTFRKIAKSFKRM